MIIMEKEIERQAKSIRARELFSELEHNDPEKFERLLLYFKRRGKAQELIAILHGEYEYKK